jgi:heterodisulfide reductase subunit A-like polyferredoxin
VQGEGAAIKAASLLAGKELSALSLARVPGGKTGHATVNKDSCTGCGNCVSVCTFDACRLQKIDGKCISRVNKMRCKACGNCVAVCPNGTMQLPEINYRATGEMIRRAFGDTQ